MRNPHLYFMLPVCLLLLAACTGTDSPTTSPEPPPAATATPIETILYEEGFDDSETCFNLDVDPGLGSLQIANGELVMGINQPSTFIYATCEDVEMSDFKFEMDVFDESGQAAFHFYGLQFRKGVPDGSTAMTNHYYLFRLGQAEDARTAVCAGLATDRSWEENLTEAADGSSCWLELAAPIPTGQWNHHAIEAKGTELSYSVNDTVIAQITHTELIAGRVALFIGTHEAESARVRVDNVRITELSNED